MTTQNEFDFTTTDLSQITVEHCVRAYSGKQGCMCGCKGEYRDQPKQIARILAKLQAHPHAKIEDGIIFIADDKIEDGERNYVVYLKDVA